MDNIYEVIEARQGDEIYRTYEGYVEGSASSRVVTMVVISILELILLFFAAMCILGSQNTIKVICRKIKKLYKNKNR